LPGEVGGWSRRNSQFPILQEVQLAIRPVRTLSKATPALEGAGVRLRRAFGFGDPSEFDPFLLLDDFRGEQPEARRLLERRS
jgi:redox-sensitive bicupin YhaK (pirin superfamily)